MKPSSKKNKNLIFPYFLLFLQPVFMASNLIVARGGVEFVPPVSLAFWRWTTVFILLIPFFYKPILKKIKIFKDEFLKLFFLGLTGCGICGAFPFIAGQTTTVVNMAVIYTSSPIFIILLSSLIYKEKIKLIQILGLILCLFGVFSIIFKGNVSILSNLDFTVGDIWMLGAAISWALYSVYLLNWKSKFDLITRFVLIAMFGSISLFPFYLFEEFQSQSTTFDLNFLFWVIFAAVSPAIIAFTLYAKVQRYLGASITGFTLYLFTVYGAFYGLVFFGETLEYFHLIGAFLVFTGVYLAKKN